jgi:hypothetical protein
VTNGYALYEGKRKDEVASCNVKEQGNGGETD